MTYKITTREYTFENEVGTTIIVENFKNSEFEAKIAAKKVLGQSDEIASTCILKSMRYKNHKQKWIKGEI